jgi:hypothetical protein
MSDMEGERISTFYQLDVQLQDVYKHTKEKALHNYIDATRTT